MVNEEDSQHQDDEIAFQGSDYDADALKHLSDRDHVRERPSMYIGDTTLKGLHHLVYEVVDNSIDEAMAGYAKHISVRINADGSVTVEDDGRGIPVARHEQLSQELGREVSTLEGVMTVLKFGGKFEKKAYETSGGLHGVGVTVVNFLSQWCEVEVYRDGYVWSQSYEYGIPTGPVIKGHPTKKHGTKTTFKPDGSIFPNTKFDFDTLYKRLQELAFLNAGVHISFYDERIGEGGEFCYQRGIVEFVEHLNRASEPLHPDVILIEGKRDGVRYEIAMQYCNEYTENVHSYVNNINTIEGGTHVSGFRSALTRVMNAYGRKEGIFKDLTPAGDDFREGLTAVVSLRVPHPQFEGQTKTKLGNSEVEGIVNAAVGDALQKYLEENPRTAKTILRKALLACEAREAARKAKDLLRKRKDALSGGGLPGKLRDCISNKMEECELYLVEGDSAGGSAEGGRFREFQAILPLRGKIINAYKSREDKVLNNEEVQSMIQAIGCGIGEDLDISKRRYNKVVIMTDADVDGSHIRTLLLCFFYRQMYQLVASGHVYLAQPPLFRVVQGKSTRYYVQTEEDMKRQLLERGLSDCRLEIEGGRIIEGDLMRALCDCLANMEDAMVALEKRGISLKAHAERISAENKLPVFMLTVGNDTHWFFTRESLEAFIEQNNLHTESVDEPSSDSEDVADTLPAVVTELHEVKTINAGLSRLAEFGFTVRDLIPEVRTGSTESKFYLYRDENRIGMDDLRALLPAVRKAGEKGMQVTRFKGLGEMNPEELRETTLDPNNRTLLQVSLNDAAAADEMFRVLMGDKVEPRREFIEKHALEVRNLDV
ncbi:MAG: DNA topoisomerase (ATP-hydrolyzing) [Pirellulaceae bacterium]|nr:MAG: DNA topoisomerase (ATP-hydrolyzing) [Pirellulaceae bacterium]